MGHPRGRFSSAGPCSGIPALRGPRLAGSRLGKRCGRCRPSSSRARPGGRHPASPTLAAHPTQSSSCKGLKSVVPGRPPASPRGPLCSRCGRTETRPGLRGRSARGLHFCCAGEEGRQKRRDEVCPSGQKLTLVFLSLFSRRKPLALEGPELYEGPGTRRPRRFSPGSRVWKPVEASRGPSPGLAPSGPGSAAQRECRHRSRARAVQEPDPARPLAPRSGEPLRAGSAPASRPARTSPGMEDSQQGTSPRLGQNPCGSGPLSLSSGPQKPRGPLRDGTSPGLRSKRRAEVSNGLVTHQRRRWDS